RHDLRRAGWRYYLVLVPACEDLKFRQVPQQLRRPVERTLGRRLCGQLDAPGKPIAHSVCVSFRHHGQPASSARNARAVRAREARAAGSRVGCGAAERNALLPPGEFLVSGRTLIVSALSAAAVLLLAGAPARAAGISASASSPPTNVGDLSISFSAQTAITS